MPNDFRISSGDGTAYAVFAHNLLTVDVALGTTAERTAYETTNREGAALAEAHREGLRAWYRDNAELDFPGDRDDWVKSGEHACRPLAAPIPAATAKSVAALKALYAAQQTALAGKDARARIAARYLEVDAEALDLIARWESAFLERESLGRLIVRGDGSSVAGRGHYSRASGLGTSISLNADDQRHAAKLITTIAPRATVARIVEAAA